MKISELVLVLLLAVHLSLFISSCGEDPEPVNEEEVITTLIMTFKEGGNTAATFIFRDSVITTDTLAPGKVYDVTLELLNESVSPVDTITNEVKEEGTTHQFFFQPASGLNISFTYNDTDDEGHPIGLSSAATTTAASAGKLTVTLRHEPDKHASGVASGDITNAGGETDVEVTFDVVIQ
jgi:hypothetical protein